MTVSGSQAKPFGPDVRGGAGGAGAAWCPGGWLPYELF